MTFNSLLKIIIIITALFIEYLPYTRNSEVSTVNIPILWMRKLMPREVKFLSYVTKLVSTGGAGI